MLKLRVHLRTLMAAVVIVALALAVIVQSIRLNRALVREQRVQAEARAVAAEYHWTLATLHAVQQRLAPRAAPEP
jgi:hypothetical protein